MLFKRAIPALGGGAMPKAVRKHRAQQVTEHPTLAAKPPKERPFFVSITENVPFARVLLSNTECPEVLSEPPKECAL